MVTIYVDAITVPQERRWLDLGEAGSVSLGLNALVKELYISAGAGVRVGTQLCKRLSVPITTMHISITAPTSNPSAHSYTLHHLPARPASSTHPSGRRERH